ncbi:MAG: 50S ribosomal protein L1, partial [Patescibacteria group bacterium]
CFLCCKILGPKGLMPNPKNETVTKDVAKAVKELSAGKFPFRNDSTSNLHMLVGRVSFTAEQLKVNIEAAIEAIRRAKPSSSKGTYIASMFIASSMGPSVKLTL